jgi:hypothetical protein
MTARSSEDHRYFHLRKYFSERVGPQELWSVIDQWPLYVGMQNLARFMQIYETVKNSGSEPGHVAEFGTWHGASTMLMAKALRITQPLVKRHFHCFDTFEGLPPGSSADGDHNEFGGSYVGDLERFRTMIDLYDLGDVIHVHKGRIEETLPEALKDESLYFNFVLIDCDLYEPTKVALDLCHDRLMLGGCIAFDEWGDPAWPGETKAAMEFLSRNDGKYRESIMFHTGRPSLLLRKLAR